MKEKLPLVSILVCNYNYGRYIGETLNSALNQTYPNIEIVIVDDGSSDNSLEVIQEIMARNAKSDIKLEAKKKNQGICYARNEALALAKGDYFVFLDSDDIMPQDYVSKLWEVADKKKADVVYCDMKSFGDDDSLFVFPDYDPKELLIHNYLHISSLVKKSAIKKHQFDTNLNRKTLEDYDFWLGLSLMGLSIVKAKTVYLKYRIQMKSRNNNSVSLGTRILEFTEVWRYSITKYRAIYPNKVPDDIVFDEMTFQINQINGELTRLNKIVHKNLKPEIKKRDLHIEHLNQLVEHLQGKNEQLAAEKNHFKGVLEVTLNSPEYITGTKMVSIPRRIKKIIKR